MHDRHDLTDAEWAVLEPLLPTGHRAGVAGGVITAGWSTGCCGGRGPVRLAGHAPRVWQVADGVLPASPLVGGRHLGQVLEGLRAGCDAGEGPGWTVGVDSTVVRAHQDAAGASRQPPADVPAGRLAGVLEDVSTAPGHTGGPSNYKDRAVDDEGGGADGGRGPQPRRDREAIGRSRGGLSTKIHLLADLRSRPLARVTTAGQRGDALGFEPLMSRLRIHRQGRGRPRTRPGQLLGDKAYSSRRIRSHLRRRAIRAVILEPADQAANRRRRGPAGGRPPAFDTVGYRQRNTTERAVNKLKAHRAVATRTDKREYVFNSTIDVASIRIWLRDLTRHPPNRP